jgi:ornithine carbamoyltransferase
MRHFLSVTDLSPDELVTLLDRATHFKRDPGAARLPRTHAAALLFEQPSLRTRTAYEVALMHLGGRAITFETRLGQREAVADVARTLSYLVSVIVARVRDHTSLQVLAEGAQVPVVNALSDREHPVEVLADALTLRERWGDLAGRRLAYVGDGNNICHSLLLLAPLLGLDLAVAGPAGYAAADGIVQQARALAAEQGTHLHLGTDPAGAVASADAVYTDVWASAGQEQGAEGRRQAFEPYQVNARLLSLAQPGAVVLHCLPARRGEEITAEVLEGPRSLAFHRLSNLVPVTTALLSWLLEQMEDKDR